MGFLVNHVWKNWLLIHLIFFDQSKTCHFLLCGSRFSGVCVYPFFYSTPPPPFFKILFPYQVSRNFFHSGLLSNIHLFHSPTTLDVPCPYPEAHWLKCSSACYLIQIRAFWGVFGTCRDCLAGLSILCSFSLQKMKLSCESFYQLLRHLLLWQVPTL